MRLRVRRFILMAAAVAAAGFGFSASGAERVASDRLEAGMQAPEFSRTDLSGAPVALSALRGKVVLLDFWASWCAPCIVEIPHLIDLQARYGKMGLRVIGVSMDDSPAPVRALMQRFAFNYPLILGDAKFGRSYGGVLGLPLRFLIARDGKILSVWRGDVSPAAIEKALKAALRHN